MLRLSPSLRTAVGIRIFTSARQSPARLPKTTWTHSILAKPHGVIPQPGIAERLYATVHGDTVDHMWREHGNVVLDNAANREATQPQQPDRSEKPGLNALLREHLSALELSEARKLMTALYGTAKNLTRINQRNLRSKIHRAVRGSDQLSELRDLADQYAIPRTHKPCSELHEPSTSQQVDVGVHGDNNTSGEEIQLLDLSYIQRTMPLPTEDQYPDALPELFVPQHISTAIHNQCQTQRISLQVDLDMTPKKGLTSAARKRLSRNESPIFVCSVKVEMTDFCTATAFGEGIGKKEAKQAAWLHLVSKLHVDGTLKELFPEDKHAVATKYERDVEQIQISANEPHDAAAAKDEMDLQPVELDEAVKQNEKDAKIEIYDYAASLGLVPSFETKVLLPRSARVQRRSKAWKAVRGWQVRIRLEGRDINVSAIGRDLHTAEVAAALAFKAEAEKQHIDSGSGVALKNRRILTADNAKNFFDFYKSHTRITDVTLEQESRNQNGGAFNIAKLLINGSQIGQEVAMSTKAEAQSIAYLTAAVELTSADPALLREFEVAASKTGGKVLRPVRPVDLRLNSEAVATMRDGLLEAREGGLSDTRRTLGAETSDSRSRVYQSRPRLSPDQQSIYSNDLLQDQRTWERNPALEELRSKRAGLPMSQYRNQVLSMVSENPYSIIVGATGSGKTTQVPQILFEHAIEMGHGSSCNIICTQPRRIAATSVAQRVAAERNESLRKTVGHQVRFDSRPPYNPFGITYCTTGVLLEKLKHDPEEVFDTTSHICIDEVHERDLQIDLLMIVLKQAIRARQAGGKSVPKIILMSATLDTELFASYFSKPDDEGRLLPCPALSVPGRTFPVQERYLGSILDEMRETYGSELTNILQFHRGTEDYLTAENAFSASYRETTSIPRKNTIIDWKQQDPADLVVANEKQDALVPVSLLAATIAHLCKTTEDGAILAFLPGIGEIIEAEKILMNNRPFGINFNDAENYRIFPLHSTSTREQQAEIFNSLPSGCRKIILATNIAETSVTVTDVKYVVDSGKLRENRYDQLRRITKLQCVWVSRSNAKQRAGRAGRVQDGYYYALYSQERSQNLEAIGQPELLRSDLQETCLSIKAQNFGEQAGSFLAQAIEPPTPQAVSSAIQNLIDIEAITSDESLTVLGRVLSKLPVHPSLGKMILLGVIFRCLDPMIILGAASEERPLFVTPMGMKAEANKAHELYAPEEQSDQLAMIEAFQELRMLRDARGLEAARQRAGTNFLHWGAFKTIDQSTRQIEEVLVECGLIPEAERGAQQVIPACGPVALNRNSQNPALIKALIVAGLSSNIGVKMGHNGLTYRTHNEDWVTVHPRSRNAESVKKHVVHPSSTIFSYSALAKGLDGDTLMLRDTTKVTALQTILFGGQLRLGDGKIEVNEWLPFNIRHSDPTFASRLLLEFRKALDRVLYRAFESLQDLAPEKGGQFADDPVRENFVTRVVRVLSLKERFPAVQLKEWTDLLRRDRI